MNPLPTNKQTDEQGRKQLEKAFAVLQDQRKLIKISDLKHLRLVFAIRILTLALPILVPLCGGGLYLTWNGTGTVSQEPPHNDYPDPPHKIGMRKIYGRGEHPDHVWLWALIHHKLDEVQADEKLVIMETDAFGPTRSFVVSITDAGEMHGIAFLYTKTNDVSSFAPISIKNSKFRVPSMSHKGLLYLLLTVQTNTDPNKIQLREGR